MRNPDAAVATEDSPDPRNRRPARILLAAYLLHLAVPLVLGLDSFRTVHNLEGMAANPERVTGFVCLAWIAVALGAQLLTRDRRRFLERMSKPLLIFFGLCISLAIGEVAVRAKVRYFNRAVLKYPPGKFNFDFTRWHIPGVSPKVTFTVNALGLRGPMPPQVGNAYRIITIGGSTTECIAQDDAQEWPHLLMVELNQRQKRLPVWVGNAGVSGLATVDHASCLRRLSVLRQADLLIFLIGVNDLAAALLFDGASTQKVLEDRAALFAQHAPDGVSHVRGLLRRSWLLALVRNSLKHLSQMIFAWRSQQDFPIGASLSGRAAGPVLPLPDLRLALAEYAQRVRTLEQLCRQYQRRCVFLTQPTMWRAGLSAAEQSLFYSGGVGSHGVPSGYVSAPELGRAMAAYNQVLLAVCREDQLECYDMAAAIPKDTSAFSDESHYNDNGTRLVADYLAERLLASPPLNGTKAAPLGSRNGAGD
ncbi:MAG TPA: SGNH/GDSL hydrolase family protein [Candidatus Sulfotelmatobacter sp.]|nr:SGNH/GDSL hydrolase family protein [Candidatus Sulfotelmatobacter sp.]